MNITLYGKKRTTKEGKAFTSFLTRLTKKDGDQIVCSVKFRDGVTAPKELPCNIVAEKSDMSLATGKYMNPETGEVSTTYTLWIAKYTDGEPYVDHSLDDFE